MDTELPTKKPAQLFYRDAIECLQALLTHPLFEPHLSFVPRKVWTSAARICRIYEDWLSGDRAWDLQVLSPFVYLVGR
jgi:Plavaka transposase